MSDNIDYTVTDNLIVGRVIPHIYAFSTPSAPDALKVGDTYRLISKRLDEWKKYYADVKKEYEHSAKLDDNRIFRDYEVHKFLVNEKKRFQLNAADLDGQYYSREFFKNATREDLDEAIEDIKKSAINNDGKYKFYTSERLPEVFTFSRGSENYPLRPNQERTVSRFISAIDKGYTNLLMYAVMRFGKSFTAMTCALKMNAKVVVILSAKADVQAEWKQTIESHVNFLDYDYLNKDGLDESNSTVSDRIKKNRKVVVFLTFQDLQGEEIKERHKDLFSNTLDLLIVDESHFGARASEYGKVLSNLGLNQNEIKKELKDYDDNISESSILLKEFHPKVCLHLSGTPYRILMGDEFKDEQIIAFYQFVDIVESQKEWDDKNLIKGVKKEWENPYFGFPQMIRFAFNPNKSTREILRQLKVDGKSHSFSDLFRTNSLIKARDGSHKEFKFKKEILELFQAIDGKKSDSNMLSFLNYDKIIEGKLCRHIVCVLPFKASCDALECLISENPEKFIHLNEYEIINISGVDKENLFPNVNDVKRKITDCELSDKKTITLTVNRMLTGTTVPEWDTMLYFKNSSSPQEYDQSIFRLQNQYVKTYENDDNELIKLNFKPQTLLVDFDPDRLFQMQIQKSLFYNINVDDRGSEALEERIKKELEISPIVCLNNNKIVQITPTNIIDAVRNYSQNKSIIDEATDVPYDVLLMKNTELRELILSLKPIDSKKGIEITPAEGIGNTLITDFPDYGIIERGESIEVNVSKGLPKKNTEDDLHLIEKKLAAYRLRILFYAFLSNSKLASLKNILESLEDSNNRRILKNVGIVPKDLILMEKFSSLQILNSFEWKIKNINDLGRDKSLNSIERATRAMKKFARVSDSEVVMPLNVANDLVELIPNNKISGESIIIDLASKQGELAIALYKRYYDEFPNLINNIFSVTTSPLAYELTRKIYESLCIPVKNIFDFTSFDLLGHDKDTFINQLKELNPDVILAGPPFQKLDGGGREDSGSGSAIYHEYFNLAKQLNPSYISMILKASWYSGGKAAGLKQFRKSIIDDSRMAILHDYPDPTIYFDSPVSLRGGVCTFLWDAKYKGDCHVYNHINNTTYEQLRPLRVHEEDILIRYNLGIGILNKVILYNEETIAKEASARNVFKLSSNNKDVNSLNGKNKHKVYLSKGKIGFILENKIPKYTDIKCLINEWKVIVAKASPGFDELPHSIISTPIISEPGSLCTDTHLLVRKVENREEAENLVYYMKTRFFRFMMLLAKNNHNMNQDVFRFVPLQMLNKRWSDNELFYKYKLSVNEIEFIKSVIKERR